MCQSKKNIRSSPQGLFYFNKVISVLLKVNVGGFSSSIYKIIVWIILIENTIMRKRPSFISNPLIIIIGNCEYSLKVVI